MDEHDISERLSAAEDFEDEEFIGGACSGLDLRGKHFSRCRFEAVTLDKAQLQAVVLDECAFVRCDLSMARVDDCSFRGVRFEHTKLMGVNWIVARDLLFDVSFEGCVLSYGVFANRKLRKAQLVDCVAHEVDFSGADLTEASLRGTDLRDATFARTTLVRTDLSTALNYRIDPANNKLGKTRFSMDAGLETLRHLGIIV